MKQKNKILFLLLFVVLCSAIYLACTGEDKTAVKSSISIYCDESIYNLLTVPFQEYNAHFKEIETNHSQASSWEVMAKLLSGEVPIIFISRDFTKREDSLMKAYNVESIEKYPIANDALTFFTQIDTPLDTLTDAQILDALLNNTPLMTIYKKLTEEPTFVINHENSSEYENLLNLVVKYKNINRKFSIFKLNRFSKSIYKNTSKLNWYWLPVAYII
jgi:ABC-type phosphate transport system substrate-binding protein